MSTKAGLIDSVRTTLAVGRIQIVEEPVLFVTGRRNVLEVFPTAGPGVWLGSRSRDDRRSEVWETLSYLTLWLCGWIVVGFCLV
jgi:hypothetical protein